MTVDGACGGMGGEEDCSDRAEVKLREGFDGGGARCGGSKGVRPSG